MKYLVTLVSTLVLSAGAMAALPRSEAPETAKAHIIEPADGAVVSSPVTVRFGLSEMGVAPAGVEKEGTGHHHLLVDQESLPPLDRPLGPDVQHFGGGQTETTLELEPGEHTLQLILGDHLHIPHNPPVLSEKVTITVE